jgi:hypothetical protein
VELVVHFEAQISIPKRNTRHFAQQLEVAVAKIMTTTGRSEIE